MAREGWEGRRARRNIENFARAGVQIYERIVLLSVVSESMPPILMHRCCDAVSGWGVGQGESWSESLPSRKSVAAERNHFPRFGDAESSE